MKKVTKENNSEQLYARAISEELAENFDNAFSLYLSAAQAFLLRSKALPNQQVLEKEKCKTSAKTCLERAERIKNARKDALKPPVLNPFSTEEQEYILEKSSKIDNVKYPIWSSSGITGSTEFEEDSVGRISQPNGSLSLVWKRPREVFSGRTVNLAGASLQPHHIHQNVVTDCSVCSAIAVCLHHHRTFGSKLGLASMFPQNVSGLPKVSSNGIYTFKFYINGTYRRITIDDSLPFTSEKRLISVIAKVPGDIVDLWPSLLEKAYLKVMGGYDFPGSNSSIDIYTLTSWIPEHIEIASSSFIREKVWKRIYDGYKGGTIKLLLRDGDLSLTSFLCWDGGNCVLTLGTDRQTENDNDLLLQLNGVSTQLLPTHSYAVLAVYENDGDYWMTILNPWGASSSVLTPSSLSNSSDVGFQKSSSTCVSQPTDNLLGVETCRDDNQSSLLTVPWETICSTFNGIYLNWNPDQFKYKIEFHGTWSRSSRTSQCVHSHFTLNYSSNEDATDDSRSSEVWVLLSRHVVGKQREDEFISIHAMQIETEETKRLSGENWTKTGFKGIYTSSVHTLTRLNVTDRSAKIAIIASYDGPYQDVNYTLRVLSVDSNLSWVVQPAQRSFVKTFEGKLSSRNAGGNSTYPSFMNNPQFCLTISNDGITSRLPSTDERSKLRSTTKNMHVRLVVEGPRDTPWNITLIWRASEQRMERVYQLRPGDVVASSGAYSYGVAQASALVAPGNYCLILSAFEPRHRGEFRLLVESSSRLEIEPIPAEDAGMFCKTVRGSWQNGCDGGSPQFGNYTSNPMFDVFVREPTSLKFRLQLVNPSPSIAINVTSFETSNGHALRHAREVGESSRNGTSLSLGRQVTTSGAYVDGTTSLSGVITPQIVFAPGHYIAVASTFDPGMRAEFLLLVYAEKIDVTVTALV